MESTQEIKYLAKPNINASKLPYIKGEEKEIYVNLFQIRIKKPLKLFQYPFEIVPEVDSSDLFMKSRLFKNARTGKGQEAKKPKAIYGECFVSGDSLYGMNEVKEPHIFTSKLHRDGEVEYTIKIQPKATERTINQNDISKDPLSKQFIEILIRDILHGNPNLEFYKGLFVLKSEKKVIESKYGSVNFYPGYTTSFMETEGGNYLNVTLKNKILSTETVLQYLKDFNYTDKKNHQEIKDNLIGRSFKVKYAKKNYVIDDILFDRSPKDQQINYDGKSINLMEYYKKRYDINIQNPNQPLILVIREGPQEQKVKLYFVPELCHLAGLDDDFLKDREFMKKLAEFTKLKPADRIRKTNEFLSLLMEEKKQGNNLSAKEKSIKYGIEVTPLDQKHKAYIMKETVLLGHKNTIIPSKGQFDVLSKKPMTKWICLYRKSNYNDADKLYKTLNKASRGYNLAIAEPEWVEMGDRDNAKIWVDTANDYMKGNQYQFAVFLLDKNDRIYTPIKKASLCTCGYISQVVKVSSLGRNEMSVCSKIILQINAKLSGVSYMAKLDNNVKERKLMIIGVDSSHIKGKRTGVAMVSTINTSFTNFYNKEQIFTEEKNEQFLFCVGGFIKEAIAQYSKFNDGKLPGGIIIYRQGVSLQQKEFLTNEVKNIQAACDEHKILYEYILVNTKTTYKFFETKKNGFENPQPGLLVLNGVTSRNFFEFYIQPQQVTGGSATPSCYTVAYGNLGFPEIIPKLTFDLCHLYSNWQGPVRVPHVLKSAEKLSKMTAKYTQDEMNENLSKGQAYL